MCKALSYLEENNMCHFDIKPENIVYNNKNMSIPFGKRFKLIDFGFAEIYPFKKYVTKFVGTIFYSPYYFINKEYPKWGFKTKTNDWQYNPVQKKWYHYSVNKNIHKLLYKTDIFSMGVVLNQLMFYIDIYLKKKHMTLFEISKSNNNLYYLIQNMTHMNIEKRFTNDECITFLIKCKGNLFNNDNDNDNNYNLDNFCCC
tara:strand:- start:673 stop:1272 length:600 start_codon:yes stop_codon:yes gene_type:complete